MLIYTLKAVWHGCDKQFNNLVMNTLVGCFLLMTAGLKWLGDRGDSA